MILTTLCVNDIHIGHNTTPTWHILKCLRREFNALTLRDVDILFIPGDIFDRQLKLSDDTISSIHSWMYQLLRDCRLSNTVLRVLHGTHSHDYNQAKLFEQINTDCELGCDFKYHDELTIEYIEKFNINVLYIPDEWRGDARQTQREVEELMVSRGISMVDISIMHGFFGFQTPDKNVHNEEFYSSITSFFVNIGHDHTYREWKNIRVPGSFDRNRQGEEGIKGYMKYVINTAVAGMVSYTFIENKYATWYKTLNVTKITTKSEVSAVIEDLITEWLQQFPITCRPLLFIRVIYGVSQDIKDVLMSFSDRYRGVITWTFEKEAVCAVSKDSDIDIKPVFSPTPINHTTILGLYQTLLEDRGYNPEDISSVLEIVNGTKLRLKG